MQVHGNNTDITVSDVTNITSGSNVGIGGSGEVSTVTVSPVPAMRLL